MASCDMAAMCFNVDAFLNNAYGSTNDADDCTMNIEPHDVEEECRALECDAEDCGIENSSINEKFQPYVGMKFESYEEAYKFYNIYGYVNGFSIRRGGCYTNIENKMTSVRIVCSKAGLKGSQKTCLESSIEVNVESLEKTPRREVSNKRCGCKASIQIRLHDDGKWRVNAFQEDHNHELVQSTPSKKRNLRSHKFISIEQRQDVQYLNEQNVGTAKMREYLACKSGGRENIHCITKDISNLVARENRKLVGVDVDTMINYFLKKKKLIQISFFGIEPDEDNVAMNIFWVDGRSKRAYQVFGDVVVFDTTYSTNKYNMPVGPFIGLNHHRQNIYFGCALIRQERKLTFKWLFETWLQAMGGKHPKAIITNQDPAMKGAIEIVFPNSIHRRCQWHVLRKDRDHLGVLYGLRPDFKAELVAVIDYSLTVSYFEKNWRAMVKKYRLEDNPHLNHMFDSSDEWVPAYFREIFMADMSTSQRSESMNVAMKIWVTCNTSLYRFTMQFDKLVEGIYERESDEDIRTMNETPVMCSCDPIEAEGRKVYTKNEFSIFREKVRKSTAYRVREVEKEKLYEVRPTIPQIKFEWYNPTRMVYVDRDNARAECECKGFQFQGLLYPHSIVVMRHVEMEPFLPSHYVLKRWMRDANSSVKRPTGVKVKESDPESIMLATLTRDIERVAIKAVKCPPAYEIVCTRIKELDIEVKKLSILNFQILIIPQLLLKLHAEHRNLCNFMTRQCHNARGRGNRIGLNNL